MGEVIEFPGDEILHIGLEYDNNINYEREISELKSENLALRQAINDYEEKVDCLLFLVLGLKKSIRKSTNEN